MGAPGMVMHRNRALHSWIFPLVGFGPQRGWAQVSENTSSCSLPAAFPAGCCRLRFPAELLRRFVLQPCPGAEAAAGAVRSLFLWISFHLLSSPGGKR